MKLPVINAIKISVEKVSNIISQSAKRVQALPKKVMMLDAFL
jgi:hypothetical protein